MNKHILPLLAVCLLITACGSGGLRTQRQAPDELAVIEGPPLWLPPDYELRPPNELVAQRRSAEIPAEAEASGTGWLLEKAGAGERDPNIRSALEDENRVIEAEEKEGFVGRLWPFGNDDANE